MQITKFRSIHLLTPTTSDEPSAFATTIGISSSLPLIMPFNQRRAERWDIPTSQLGMKHGH
jgi:hypothetical protein